MRPTGIKRKAAIESDPAVLGHQDIVYLDEIFYSAKLNTCVSAYYIANLSLGTESILQDLLSHEYLFIEDLETDPAAKSKWKIRRAELRGRPDTKE